MDEGRGGRGRDGRDGRNGERGERGLPGPQGDPGRVGLRGIAGDLGPIGPQGIPGAAGARGERGPVGPPGPDGDVGPMPRHEWKYDGGQVLLRFERPGVDGHPVWGSWSENLRGPPGQSGGGGWTSPAPADVGSGTGDGSVPYFVPAGDTYAVPIYRQALFTVPIDCEGSLEVDGALEEVN